jgi:hypothetical protein
LDPDYKPDDCFLIESVGGFRFAPLVTDRLGTLARVDVLLLRPEPPGHLLQNPGDLDNRAKTLLDALRMPNRPEELPDGDQPGDGEDPFFCLLKDDALVTKLSIDTDTLLDAENDTDVSVMVRVAIWARSVTFANMGLIS